MSAVVQVHLLARGEKLRASRAMQDRVLEHNKVTVHFNTAVDDAYPDGKGALAGLQTKDTKTGQSLTTLVLPTCLAYRRAASNRFSVCSVVPLKVCLALLGRHPALQLHCTAPVCSCLFLYHSLW